MKNIIVNYINKITLKNIYDFAYKNNIILNDNETEILYNILKNHYEDILAGNDEFIMKYLKEKFDKNNYNKIINIYSIYKNKYKNYL